MDFSTHGFEAEWLEADGLGGFASGTAAGIRTRRYHALLLVATTPPAGRVVLVNGLDSWVETPGGTFALSSQHYIPGVFHPDGTRRIRKFTAEPWPRWEYELEDGTRIQHELFIPRGDPAVVLSWRLAEPVGGVSLFARPFFSGRDYHSLHHENPSFLFEGRGEGERMNWGFYPGVPAVQSHSNGTYIHRPDWYRNFTYKEEQARGLDSAEDLASPGIFHWDLSCGEASWILSARNDTGNSAFTAEPASESVKRLRRSEEARRQSFPSALQRAGDAYIVRRKAGKTIVAGYPWFTDWGRDTFIALRGLCLATGRVDDARDILLQWAGVVSQGMLPNRFPDRGDDPEYNSVDASLWYLIAVHEFLETVKANRGDVTVGDRRSLEQAMDAILTGYAAGTRFGIKLDEDGLLSAGEPGVQLTWMDAKVGDWVVTPRIGKPVEVEALWLNALWIGSVYSERWRKIFVRGLETFRSRFWYEQGGHLFDVVDADHQRGASDTALRPNQIFAIGGLPLALLEGARARRVVDAVEARLWTPLGLRSLAPEQAAYQPRYEGGVRERDGAYHQGTVWPWLLAPFVEAWVRVRGATVESKIEARRRFLDPMTRHLQEAGLGHVSEIADGEPPHTPRGCPFQAWSVGELLRLDLVILGETNHSVVNRRQGEPLYGKTQTP
ncbi:MAG TPA: amylo-alpha-1,6-glucosidase [Candidatus Binatia bacterium]